MKTLRSLKLYYYCWHSEEVVGLIPSSSAWRLHVPLCLLASLQVVQVKCMIWPPDLSRCLLPAALGSGERRQLTLAAAMDHIFNVNLFTKTISAPADHLLLV